MYNYCPRFSNFIPFRSTTSHFWDVGHFEKYTEYDPKWPWTLQGHMYPRYVLLVSTSPTFHSFLLYNQPFSGYRPFWDKCTEWPQINLEPYKVKLPSNPYNYSPWVSNFTLWPAVFGRWRPFWDKVHRMTTKLSHPWTLQGQSYTTYVLLKCPWVPNFGLFRSVTSGFHITLLKFPIDLHVIRPKKKNKKFAKKRKTGEISKFFIQLW